MRALDRKARSRHSVKARLVAVFLVTVIAFPFTSSQAYVLAEGVKEEAGKYYDYAIRSLRAITTPKSAIAPKASGQDETPSERAMRVARLRFCPRRMALYVGEETVMMPLALDSAGEIVHSAQMSWESHNSAVATVSSAGDVTAVSPGRTIIMMRSGVARAPVAVEVRSGQRPKKSDAEFDAERASDCNDPEASDISLLQSGSEKNIASSTTKDKNRSKAGRKAAYASHTSKDTPTTSYKELARSVALRSSEEAEERLEAKAEPVSAEVASNSGSSVFFQAGGVLDGGGSEDTFSAAATSYRNAIGSPRFAAQLESQSSGVKTRKVLGSYNYGLAIPVLGLPGRGLDVNLALYYNSQLWSKDGNNKMTFNYNKGWPTYGWSIGYGRIIDNYDDSDQGDGSGIGPNNAPGSKLLVMPDGTRIHLQQTWDGTEWDFLSNDGTFLKFANGKLRFPDGTVVLYEKNQLTNHRRLPTKITTRNGSKITISYLNPYPTASPSRWAINTITDTLGRVIKFNYEAGTGELRNVTAPNQINGTQRTLVQIDYQPIIFDYNFTSSITTVVAPAKMTQIKVVKRIYQPQTGRGYLFPQADYSSYGMARKVSMRIGMTSISDGTEVAYTRYNYTSHPDNQSGGITDSPQYTTRSEWWQDKTDDNGNATIAETVFTYSRQTDTQKDTFIEIDPLQNKIESTTGTNPNEESNGLLTETLFKDINNNVLRKVVNTYTTGIDGGVQLSNVESYDETGVQRVRTETVYGQYGRVTEIKEYGFTGTVQRKTTFGYKAGDYITEYMLQLVDRVEVYDGSNNLKAKTVFVYDNYAAMGGMEFYNFPNNPSNPLPLGHDPAYDQNRTTRGNVTGVQTFSSFNPDVSVTRNSKYDIFGNLVEAQVSCCAVKTATFGTSGGSVTSYSQPLSTTDGREGTIPFLKTSYIYDQYTSLIQSVTDPDGLPTNFFYDSALRLDMVQSPTGATTVTRFDKSGGTDTLSYFQRVSYVDADNIQKTITSRSWFDGAGRTLRSGVGQGSSPSSYDAVKAVYDSQGRVIWQSNPYAGDVNGHPQVGVTMYWTKNEYDALSRVTAVNLPDDVPGGQRSRILTAYAGATVTVTDQVGRQRKSEVNGLGQLIKVTEQNPATGSLSWETSYSYDTLDNLLGVNQGNQTRSFIYDALSRLKSQTTPEGETVTYTYTPFDAVDTRTDARGVVTDYDYNDGLNRLTSVSYNTSGAPGVEATSPVSITYKTSAPGNGQVQQVSDSAGSETYGYDSLGRNTSKSRVFTGNANTYTTQYEYNAVGQQTALIYPSNKRVRTNYDSRGRFAGLDKMNGSLVDLTYLSQVSYRVSGQIASLKLANQKMSETYSYSDTRLQMTGQTVTNNQSQQTMMSLTYNYQASAGQSGANTTAGNSGQLMGVTATINAQGRNQAFTYDNVGRLKTAAGWNSTTNRRFDYDRWGNRVGVWDTNAPSGGSQIQTVTLKEQERGNSARQNNRAL